MTPSTRRRHVPPATASDGNTALRLRPLWLTAFTALTVATPLLPSETVNLGGSAFVVMLMWWMLLAAWALSGLASRSFEVKFGPVTWAWIAFLGWHSLSAIVMAWQGNPRTTWNMLWMWSSFGIAFFLARQLIHTTAERRAVVAVMVVLAVSLSVVGFYQYFYELPATRARFEKDPDGVLRVAGIDAPPGTPHRKLFEDRLYSTEPLATFALTNSFAGFLAPWLALGVGIAVQCWRAEHPRNARIASTVAAVLMLGCLVLTKSRTAYLALLFGLVLAAIYGRRTGWKPDWRWVTGLVAAGAVLPFMAVVVGGLDWLVVLETSKSFLYRVQYWRATAELIGDYPWFGCGPGNFQEYYTAYKVPEASETIAEPHNFLLEIWSTSGTFAWACFLGIFAGTAWQVSRTQRANVVPDTPHTSPEPSSGVGPADSSVSASLSKEKGRTTTTGFQSGGSHPRGSGIADDSEIGSVRPVYWGALLGCLLGYTLCAWMEGYLISPGFAVLGLPVAGLVLFGLHSWVRDGYLSTAALAIALTVILVNLLAAGGIGFAGVSQTVWLITALLLNHAEAAGPVGTGRTIRAYGKGMAAVFTVASVLGLFAFHQTAYSPVTTAETLLVQGNTRRLMRQPLPALATFRSAAEADPFSPAPWEQIAETAHELWLQTESETYKKQYWDASRENLARNQRSSHAQMLTGHHWLVAFRRFNQREYIVQATHHYRFAVELYPNYNLAHAQLAWALHLAGDPEAIAERDVALRLDELNPHAEQKLAKQRIFDPAAAIAAPARSAEQMLQEIRSIEAAPRSE